MIFITARTIDKKAVVDQNCSQFHSDGKMLPIEIKPPTCL